MNGSQVSKNIWNSKNCQTRVQILKNQYLSRGHICHEWYVKRKKLIKWKKYWYYQQVTILNLGFGDMFCDKNLEYHQYVNQKNEFLSFSKITNTNTRVSFTVHNFKITKIKRGFTFFYETRVEFNPLYYLLREMF